MNEQNTIEEEMQPPPENREPFEHIGQRLGKLDGGPVRLWLILWGHTNYKSRRCNPGYRRLSGMLGCCHQSVKNWIDTLVAAKWLKVEKVPCKTGESNNYTILNGEGQAFYCVRTLTVLRRKNAKRSTGVGESVLPGSTRTPLKKRRSKQYFSPTSRSVVAKAPSSLSEAEALIASFTEKELATEATQ